MSLNKFFSIGASFGLLLMGCACNPVADTKAEAEKIRQLEDQWGVANQNKDIEKVMGFYAADPVTMPSNGPICIGREAVRKQFESSFADASVQWNTFTWKNEFVEVSSSGDLAYVRVPNSLKIKTPVGLVEDVAKCIDIWKKIDGEWKAIVSIWNSDKALAVLQTSNALNEEFTKIEESWNEATLKQDAKALDLLLAEEYTYTDENVQLNNKQQSIAEVTSGKTRFTAPAVISDIQVNLYGTVAVVKGKNTVKATYNGKNTSGSYRFVDVFVMRDGRWQCVSTK